MKRITARFLLLLMIFAASCAGKKQDPKEDDGMAELLRTVVLRLDGEPVTYETYRYYFYGIAANMTDGDLSRFKDDPALLAELREAVLDELKMERVLRSLAKEYGISITNENWAEVDRSIEELEYRYQTGLGISLEESVAQRYGTKDLLREMLAYGNYISDPVYDYIYNPKNGVIDRSDEAVRAYFDKYNCVLHVLLTKSGYETSANVEKTAKELYTIVTLACGSAACAAAVK